MEKEIAESRCAAVESLSHCGDPEIDHLIDEIKSPESTRALYEMPVRVPRQRTGSSSGPSGNGS
ncbi:hypothetical protein BX265_6996 [Streptomyces sp. TLI_235]|nr:hypothetical protein [Streptomyces sp. TLI_235]PBC69658.1 hypothetical protein BX265_6996 [Streptomyces sp. TLI_235]